MTGKNNSTDDLLEGVQHVSLDIYRAIKDICDKNGLRYFAIGGTAIGAVRHGGFIPWDDDIDIVMPRADYNKLIKLRHKLMWLMIRYSISRRVYLALGKL